VEYRDKIHAAIFDCGSRSDSFTFMFELNKSSSTTVNASASLQSSVAKWRQAAAPLDQPLANLCLDELRDDNATHGPVLIFFTLRK
jgi:hypothetical protein